MCYLPTEIRADGMRGGIAADKGLKGTSYKRPHILPVLRG